MAEAQARGKRLGEDALESGARRESIGDQPMAQSMRADGGGADGGLSQLGGAGMGSGGDSAASAAGMGSGGDSAAADSTVARGIDALGSASGSGGDTHTDNDFQLRKDPVTGELVLDTGYTL